MTEPTTYEVTFPLAWLRALRLLAPKSDIREYMRGVAITHGYLAATNGHYLGALRDERFDGLPEVIIPVDAIDPFLSATRPWKTLDVEIKVQFTPTTAEGGRLFTPGNLVCSTVQQGFLAPEGKYPPISNVLRPVPDNPRGYPQFRWSYLVLFEKVADALGAPKGAYPKVHLTLKGMAAARVRILCDDRFEGVLMPMKDSFTEF